MRASDLKPRDYKGFLFIRDAILYGGRGPTLQAICDHVGFSSRRSAALLIERLIDLGFFERSPKGNLRLLRNADEPASSERTVDIPLVGSAPCGLPLLAEENLEAMVAVSQKIARPGATYFLLRATGTSMDKAGIRDGDLVLVRQQPVAEDGQRVVALIDDAATIKEFRRAGDKVMLLPRSTDTRHQPIILDQDFLIQGVVIETIPKLPH